MRKPFMLIGQSATPILMAVAVVASTGRAFAASTNTPLYADDFETYTNLTLLIDGTNNGTTSAYGWYSSSNFLSETNGVSIVQTSTVSTGTNAAMIPVDCTLSNRYLDMGVVVTNVWIQMDLRPSLYDGVSNPVVNTNMATMFYLNSNGNFVVHNGPATDPYNSTNWVVTTNGCVGTNETNWVSILLRVNYAGQTWSLLTTNNRTMVTNNIGFINTTITNFAGFDVYNGLATSYVDNVAVMIPAVTNYFLDVAPTSVNFGAVMRNNAIGTNLIVTNLNATIGMTWAASTPDTWLQIANPTNGYLAGGAGTRLVITNSLVTNAGGTYTGQVVVTAASADLYYEPERSVATFVLQVMDLRIAPSATNAVVMQGEWTSNSFQVWNAGPGTVDYTVAADHSWLALSRTNGSLTGETANATNTITIIYTNTLGLAAGDHTGTITVASSSGGGATLTLGATLTVQAPPLLRVSPALVTNMVMEGQNPDSQTLLIWNGSTNYDIGYQVTTSPASMSWLAVAVTNNSLAPLTTNALTINYTVGSLASAGYGPSNYNGTITVTATNRVSGAPAGGSPAIIPVTVRVNPKSRLALSPTNLSQTVLRGRDAASQGFDVWNSNGFFTLYYTISNDTNAPWLLLMPPLSGSSTGQHVRIEMQYSTANLPAGLANAVLTVVGRASDGVHEDSALDATQRITVALSVSPFATLMNDAQPSYSYRVRKGLTPANTVLHVWSGGIAPQGAMYFTVSPSESWLSATPANGTLAGGTTQAVTLTYASTAGMTPGVYGATVQINATDAMSGMTAYGSPSMFTIEIVIYGFKGFDFQGGNSGASDLVAYREANGDWAIGNLLSGYATNMVFGGNGYQAVPGDYFGDGVTELGVYRQASGYWYTWQIGGGSLQPVPPGIYAIAMPQWAGTGHTGVPGDYDGDGLTDPGVYVEQSGLWSVLLSGSGYQEISGGFGGPGYAALQAGDYDGDGKVDFGVYHRTTGLWRLLFSGSGYAEVAGGFGGAGFEPVPADYNGDGLTDPAVYETSTGTWSILLSSVDSSTWWRLLTCQFFGTAAETLVPAPGNYDGVGGADLALYDTATGSWYIGATNGVPIVMGYPLGGFGYAPVLP